MQPLCPKCFLSTIIADDVHQSAVRCFYFITLALNTPVTSMLQRRITREHQMHCL